MAKCMSHTNPYTPNLQQFPFSGGEAAGARQTPTRCAVVPIISSSNLTLRLHPTFLLASSDVHIEGSEELFIRTLLQPFLDLFPIINTGDTVHKLEGLQLGE